MRSPSLMTAAAIAGLSVLGTFAVHVRAGADLVKFPEEYAKGVLYGTVDRADTKLYRELYVNKEAADAVKMGKPVPSGTVITMVSYKAKLDEKGDPVKGPNGRFIKTDEITGIGVMEKRTGWGTEYPEAMRNGEWEYQQFTAAKAINTKANLKNCFECHKPKVGDDFLFTMSQLKGAR